MSLPYKTLKKTEVVDVCGIPIPKIGCLKYLELDALAEVDAETSKSREDMTPLQVDLLLKLHIVTILIRSRVDREWTFEKTKAYEWEVMIDGEPQTIEPDADLIDGLFDFFLNEQKRWKSDEPEEETEPAKKSTGRKSTGS